MISKTPRRGPSGIPIVRHYPFDEKCLDLARYFYPRASADVLCKLAEEFQVAAEDYADSAAGKSEKSEDASHE